MTPEHEMTTEEREQLVSLLTLRKKELRHELISNDYSMVTSVEYSKRRQIEYIDELLIQLI